MTIVLTTVLLFIFVLPVLIAKRAYSSSELSYKFTKTSILEEIVKSVFAAFVFHLLTIKIVTCFGFSINYVFLKSLILQKDNLDLAVLESDFWKILGYFSVLFFISFASFFISRNIIRYFKFDRKWDYFRYDNFWYYLLTGEILEIEEYNKGNIQIDLGEIVRYVDVLTKGNDSDVLYSGMLIEYQLGENDTLEFIVLRYPKRQVIKANKADEKKDEKRTIPSNYFVVPYKEILNLNISYISQTADHYDRLSEVVDGLIKPS